MKVSLHPPVEVIGQPECPILHRWTIINAGSWKLLLHHFLPTSRDRDPHDHPRAFVTVVVRGDYVDVQPRACKRGHVGHYDDATFCQTCGAPILDEVADHVRAPAIRYRPATHTHKTYAGERGAWTIVVMGPLVRAWGFLRDGRFWPWREYEDRYGHGFRCE